MNYHTESLLFAEDLMMDFLRRNYHSWTPATSGICYRSNYFSEFTPSIGQAVFNFSKHFPLGLQVNRYNLDEVNTNFPRGYKPIDFLVFCSKVANQVLYSFERNYFNAKENGDIGVLNIVEHLKEFLRSGEFQKQDGWKDLKNMLIDLLPTVSRRNNYRCSGERKLRSPSMIYRI
ncbi:hypothetical protein CDAR_418241 [Caerostris darwini]|uniref:Uncharacterized protein n=1 Tax=Caerostris darwini TaxID=1538125 RepID=A0AAV4M3C7_9ARAC|nr:hypothetical protein CDAR_269031 [Caerostris darwini]GIY41717.1 hypothetical protein CDAR_418241 [Caerostris darwini]